jgi:hypothetical protein
MILRTAHEYTMSILSVRASLDQFAKHIGCEVRQSHKQATLAFVDLEIAGITGITGQVRLSVDTDDAVVIAEIAVPLSLLLPPDAAAAESLFALHMMLSPAQSGARLFPSMDMQSEHLLLSCVVGSEAIRGTEGLAQFAGDCAERAAVLVNEVSQILRTRQADVKHHASSAHFLNRIRSV